MNLAACYCGQVKVHMYGQLSCPHVTVIAVHYCHQVPVHYLVCPCIELTSLFCTQAELTRLRQTLDTWKATTEVSGHWTCVQILLFNGDSQCIVC